MPRINVTKPFRYAFEGHRVVDFGEGEQDVPAEVADLAVGEGWAETVNAAPASPPADLTMAEIMEAIGKLDKDKAEMWCADGSPQVKALAEVLGREVTAAQRNDAWMAVLKEEEEKANNPNGGQE
ncbi:MAG: hypothetical protein ACOY8P_07945 [Thermodesulfobacteriota bacterium]|jgi:hypothetical protein